MFAAPSVTITVQLPVTIDQREIWVDPIGRATALIQLTRLGKMPAICSTAQIQNMTATVFFNDRSEQFRAEGRRQKEQHDPQNCPSKEDLVGRAHQQQAARLDVDKGGESQNLRGDPEQDRTGDREGSALDEKQDPALDLLAEFRASGRRHVPVDPFAQVPVD
jgi:hypothetical protein